ncbi:MAG: lysophospholipid acyltransferase family protein [Bacteroidales bacterium]
MIKAKHHSWYERFFRFYSRFMLSNHFRRIIINGSYTEKNRPVMLIGNHFSWWDGFIANYLNMVVFKKRFHIMMLEEQLKPRMFLNKAGAYSIKKNTRDVVNTLNYTVELMKDKNNIVVMYPQGSIQSVYHYPLEFEKGVEAILNRSQEVDVYFLVALVDYFSHRKPALTLGIKEYPFEKPVSTLTIQEAYNEYMQYLIAGQTEEKIW